MVQNIRRDYVRVPFYYNTAIQGGPEVNFQAWVVPAVVFWNLVLTGGPVPLGTCIQEVQEHCQWRHASEVEADELREKLFLSIHEFGAGFMVPVGQLAECLQGISRVFERLHGPTFSFLQGPIRSLRPQEEGGDCVSLCEACSGPEDCVHSCPRWAQECEEMVVSAKVPIEL